MENFLREKFKYDLNVIDFHKQYLIKNNFLKPEGNLLIIYDFIISTFNNIKEIDPEILDELGEKLYEDITSIYKFYLIWKKRKDHYHNYFLKYMYSIPSIKELYDKLDALKERMNALNILIKKTDKMLKKNLSDEELKKIKKQNVDAIYEYSLIKDEYFALKEKVEDNEKEREKLFRKIFDEFSTEILNEIEEILNIKLFYFAKYYSIKLKESYLIKKFALRSGIDLSLYSLSNYFYKHTLNINKEKIREIIKGIE